MLKCKLGTLKFDRLRLGSGTVSSSPPGVSVALFDAQDVLLGDRLGKALRRKLGPLKCNRLKLGLGTV